MMWRPHLAGGSSCTGRRLGPPWPQEARRPLHGGVSASVEQDVRVARHHLAFLHHCDGAVIEQTPPCVTNGGGVG